MFRLFRVSVAGAVAAAVLGFAGPAGAADGVVIRKVDTSDHPTVKLDVVPPAGAGLNDVVSVQENGAQISDLTVKTTAEAGVSTGIVLVLDSSADMTQGDALTKIKRAASEVISAKLPNEHYAIVAFNAGPRLLVNFTDDTTSLLGAIENLRASGDPQLWDGINMAATILGERPDLQPNVVVVSGAADAASKSTVTEVRSTLRASKAMLFASTISQGPRVNSAELSQLAAATNGRYLDTTDPAATEEILAGLQQSLRKQMVVTYTSPSEPKALDITVAVGASSTTIHASPGTVAAGAEVAPEVVKPSRVSGLLDGYLGILLIGLVSLAGVLLLLFGIIEIVGSERNQLARRLSHYTEGAHKKTETSKLTDSQLIKKAVEKTGDIASERGLLQVVQQRLEQADLPLRPAEAIFFTGVATLVAMVIGTIFLGPLGLALAGLVFAYMPIMITSTLAKRRKNKFNSLLPDTLQLLSGSMRAGLSLVQGLDAVAKQSEAPMSSELQRAMSEARLGRSIDEALGDVATRMGSKDFEWAVMAIRIQREVGGNLSELLLTVSETMVERERLRREVKALTAEGRISALVLVGLPPSIGVLISVMNPAYMNPLITSTIGQLALAGAAVMMGLGYWLMTKMIEIEA